MDLVESELFTAPLILLQTVLEEVRHRSLPLYNRLKALTKIEDKRICVFYNEYRTYVIRLDVFDGFSGLLAARRQLPGRKGKRQTTGMIAVSAIHLFNCQIDVQ